MFNIFYNYRIVNYGFCFGSNTKLKSYPLVEHLLGHFGRNNVQYHDYSHQ